MSLVVERYMPYLGAALRESAGAGGVVLLSLVATLGFLWTVGLNLESTRSEAATYASPSSIQDTASRTKSGVPPAITGPTKATRGSGPSVQPEISSARSLR